MNTHPHRNIILTHIDAQPTFTPDEESSQIQNILEQAKPHTTHKKDQTIARYD